MAPEQAGGKSKQVGASADVYAMGAILYELLTGHPPFEGDTPLDTLMQVVSSEPIRVSRWQPGVAPELEIICLKCLEKDPLRRYSTAQALADDLHRYLAGEPIRAQRPAGGEVTGRGVPWGHLVTGVIGITALIVISLVLARVIDSRIVYSACAAAGGTLLVCQFLLSAFSFGHSADAAGHGFHEMVPHDTDAHDIEGHDGHSGHDSAHEPRSSWFAGLLTLRTGIAGVAFFGLAGLAGLQGAVEEPYALCLSLAAGSTGMYVVAVLGRSLRRLESEGTTRIERAVGQRGTVYVTIPGAKAGAGKIHLNLQNRTVEYQAVTAKQELTTGTPIVVVAVVGSDTVEVQAAGVE
jgi:hypothetical protein